MSDELRLPEELAACEARLAATLLVGSGIDRDQLLYRAGWAAGAGTARLADGNRPSLKGGILAASLASAAVAASLATAITLQWRPVEVRHEQAPLVASHDEAGAKSEALMTTPAERTAEQVVERGPVRPTDVERFLANFASGDRRSLAAPVFALRGRAFAGGREASPTVAADAASPAVTMTARQLLDEILPETRTPLDSAPAARWWPWRGLTIGETI